MCPTISEPMRQKLAQNSHCVQSRKYIERRENPIWEWTAKFSPQRSFATTHKELMARQLQNLIPLRFSCNFCPSPSFESDKNSHYIAQWRKLLVVGTFKYENARSWERSKLRTLEAENAWSWECSKLRRYLDVHLTSNFFHCALALKKVTCFPILGLFSAQNLQ